MTDLDIDIWGRGRDAAAAGRVTTPALRANYPYVDVPDSWREPGKLRKLLNEHFPRNHSDQLVFKIRLLEMDPCVFFQNPEDAEYCRGLFYIY